MVALYDAISGTQTKRREYSRGGGTLWTIELLVEVVCICFVRQRIPLVYPSAEIDLLTPDAAKRHGGREIGIERLTANRAGENRHHVTKGLATGHLGDELADVVDFSFFLDVLAPSPLESLPAFLAASAPLRYDSLR